MSRPRSERSGDTCPVAVAPSVDESPDEPETAGALNHFEGPGLASRDLAHLLDV